MGILKIFKILSNGSIVVQSISWIIVEEKLQTGRTHGPIHALLFIQIVLRIWAWKGDLSNWIWSRIHNLFGSDE